MSNPATEERLAQLLDPAFRVGDTVTWGGSEGSWGVISDLESDTAIVRVFALDKGTTKGYARQPYARLSFMTGSPHLSRRPGHPFCLDPDCTQGQQGGDGWIVIHGWPDAAAKAELKNWRWVQCCEAHRDLAEAWMAQWVGPRGLISREDGSGKPVLAPALPAPELRSSAPVTAGVQDDLFALAGIDLGARG